MKPRANGEGEDETEDKECEMKYYKCLRENLAAFHDEAFVWTVGDWMKQPASGSDPCGVGLHLGKSLNSAISFGKFPFRVFEATYRGEIAGQDEAKIRVSEAKLTRELKPKWLTKTKEFIASIPAMPWYRNDGDPDPAWKLFDTRAAARDAAGAAARAAAWAAAGAAARDAAWAAAGAAARDAAWAAARDAALHARLAICTGLNLDKKHRGHILDRWRVWEKGYGLLCDVGGVLYVYKKP